MTALARFALVVSAPTSVWLGMFLNLPTPTPKNGHRLRADLEPVGVAQLDLDPLVALGDEEDREAATRSGVQLDVGVGDLQALGRRVGRVRWCRDERAREEPRKGDRPYPVRPEPQPVRPEPQPVRPEPQPVRPEPVEGLRQAQP